MPEFSFLYAGVMPRAEAGEQPKWGCWALAYGDRRQMLAYRAARPVDIVVAIRATGGRSGAKASKEIADRGARGGLCAAGE